jgi:Fic family protein
MISEYFNGNPTNIKSILREHTDTDLHNKIDEYFKGNVTSIEKSSDKIKNQPLPEQTTEVISFRLDEETSKKLRLLLGYLGISQSEWISIIIKKKVNEDLQELLKSLVEKKNG